MDLQLMVGDYMLNYSNLNDVEFEALCRDIMERMLNTTLRRFAAGKDHGVDLTDDVNKSTIIVQVKHYRNSTTTALVNSLKSELSKVTKLAPKQYYICCSRELTANNINTLYQHFKAYMDSDRHIITLIEIDDFLKQPENHDILKKHFKLWLDDTGILDDIFNNDLFIDCEALLDDIDDQKKLFVQTEAFDRALRALENRQILCIIGNPGVGKSITSKMLVLHYAAQGYHVRYTSDVTDLAALKRSLMDIPERKEVILLDDCFGQAYFEMKSSQSSELIALIKYVKRHPQKVLILNSRVTIFHDAQQRQPALAQSLDRNDFKIFILDMDSLSLLEKAKIFYNHLTFSNIPDDYFSDIRKDHRYRQIVAHQNYSPRIIEFVCSPNRYSSVHADQFFDFIQNHLGNPSAIWADEYDNRLKQTDRILLQTIYSLTTTTVSVDLVRQCFNRRISSIPDIDKTLDQFTQSFQRLNKGFIRFIDHNGKQELTMYNPSVNDFLDGRLPSGGLERNELMQSICTLSQLRLIPEKDRIPYISKLIESEMIDNFIFPSSNAKIAFIGHCIIALKLLLPQYQSALLEYLADPNRLEYTRLSPLPIDVDLSKDLLLPEIWEFYGLESFLADNNHLYTLLNMWTLNDAVPFIVKCDSLFRDDKRAEYLQQATHYLQEAIDDYCEIEADWYDVDVSEILRENSEYTPYGLIPDVDGAAEHIKELVAGYALDDLHNIFYVLPDHFSPLISNIGTNSISVSGADSLVESYLYDGPDDYEPIGREPCSDYSLIDAIFER